MAKTAVSDEEIQLRKRARRRLVGAIALVLLAVVFLPMVLDHEPKQRPQEVNIQIPPIPNQAPTMPAGQTGTPTQAPSDAVPSAPPAPGKPGPSVRPDVSAVAPSSEPAAPSAAASKAAPPSRAAATPKPPAPPKLPAVTSAKPAGGEQDGGAQAPAGDGYVIRLGAFSDPDNAKQLLAKLKGNKIAGYAESVKTPHGQRVRVRAGPFATREAAQSARDRLRQLKLIPPPSEGKIVRQGE